MSRVLTLGIIEKVVALAIIIIKITFNCFTICRSKNMSHYPKGKFLFANLNSTVYMVNSLPYLRIRKWREAIINYTSTVIMMIFVLIRMII